MKLVVQVRLLPTPEQAAALETTLREVNTAANLVSATAHATGVTREYGLRKHTYATLKERGLGAQAAQHVIKKVADAYATLKAGIRAGNLGPEGSPRRTRAIAKPISFRPDAAQPYDDRCLSWQIDARMVSIWTVAGRLKNVAFTASAEQLTSTGTRHSGKGLNAVRHRNRELRRRLQTKQTKSAKRLLKKRRRTEARFTANTNHVIAKQIVTEAERTGQGIALEDLHGIRHRVRLRKPQRVALHAWSFHQLGSFIAYKAARAGVAVIHVDPSYTSQQCSACGHVAKKNRPDQETFSCTSCGFAEHADVNAARNIASRGHAGWAVSHAA